LFGVLASQETELFPGILYGMPNMVVGGQTRSPWMSGHPRNFWDRRETPCRVIQLVGQKYEKSSSVIGADLPN
jgi:hypothetical protein